MDSIYNNVTKEILDEKVWLLMGEGIIKIFLVLLLSRIIIRIGKTIINKFFKARLRSPIRVSERRETTLIKLLENIITYVINFIALIMILEIFSFDVNAFTGWSWVFLVWQLGLVLKVWSKILSQGSL